MCRISTLLTSCFLASYSPAATCKRKRGEGGIRTLGSLLGYGALAKRCFRPLSHLTKIAATALWAVRDAPQARGYRRELRISPGISAFQSAICNGRYRFRRVLAIFIGVANCPLPTD